MSLRGLVLPFYYGMSIHGGSLDSSFIYIKHETLDSYYDRVQDKINTQLHSKAWYYNRKFDKRLSVYNQCHKKGKH